MSAYLVRLSSAPLGNFFVGQESRPARELLARFRRLIPERNILPQARRIFSEGQLAKLNSQGQTALNRLFTLLFSRNVRNIQQFKYALFEDLHLPVTSSPASNSEWVRYTLAEFGCDLAYRVSDGQLIIGTFAEIGENISFGKLLLLPINPSVRQILSAPRPTITPVVASTEIKALVAQSKGGPLEKDRGKIKRDPRIELRDLLRKGQAELAAALLFSVIDRPADIIEVVAWASKDLAVFDQYENSWEALELQCDAPALQRDIGNDIKLLGYLLGRYSQSAPMLAAGIIKRIAVGRLGLTSSRGLALAVDALALVESNEQRANIIQGLTALGEHKLANLIFASAMSDALPLYHDRFGGTLGVLNKRDGEVFLAEEEYEADRKSIYRGAPPATYAIEKSGTDRDKHLRDMVDQAIEEGNADYAAQAAFAGYSDITARINNISQLRFVKFGQLLANLSPEKRRSVMIDLAFAPKSERSEKAMAETTLALLWLDGKEDIEATADFLLVLLAEETAHPGMRFAVRRLLSAGLSDFLTCGNYALVYDQLEEMSPELVRNDCHQFVASDGKLSNDDPPLGRRGEQLKHYLAILDDKTKSEEERIVAARMLGRLHAVEHFKKLARKALRLFRKDWCGPFTLVLVAAVAEINEKIMNEPTRARFSKLKATAVDGVSFGLIAEKAFIALQVGLNPTQISELFGTIKKKCGKNTLAAFNALQAALHGAKDILSAAQISGLLGMIVEKCKEGSPDAFNALPAALQAGLNLAQITELFGKVANTCKWKKPAASGGPAGLRATLDLGPIESFGEYTPDIFPPLRAALQGAKDILPPDQITELFGMIVEKCGKNAPDIFHALLAALRGAKDILTPSQITKLFGIIIEKCGHHAVDIIDTLPAVLRVAKDVLTPAQITELFGKIVEKYRLTSYVFKALKPSLITAKDILTPAQITELFGKIVGKCGEDHSIEYGGVNNAFEALPTALQGAKDILSPAQITELFGKIVEKCGDKASAIFNVLPAALQTAKDVLTPTQITELFENITEIYGAENTPAILNALAIGLQTAKNILTPIQIAELFGEIVNKCKYFISDALNTLPAALQAGLNPAQIPEFFIEINGVCYKDTRGAFNALSAALQAGLNPTQIAKLFAKIAHKCNENYCPGAYNALPAALQGAKNILSPTQITKLFGMIVEKCGDNRGSPEPDRTNDVFNALPAALQGAKDILSPAQISELFGMITENCRGETYFALSALSAALQGAKGVLSPDQIAKLLGKITGKCKWGTPVAFRALPVALQGAKGVLSPDQMTELLGKIVDNCDEEFIDYIPKAFNSLSAVLQAGKDILSSPQMAELIRKVAEMCGHYIDDAFIALPGIIRRGMTPDQILADQTLDQLKKQYICYKWHVE